MFSRTALIGLGLALSAWTLLPACDDDNNDNNGGSQQPGQTTTFSEDLLVADQSSVGAAHVDNNLINPWGIAFGPTGLPWVANNGTGVLTVYDLAGATKIPAIAVPGPAGSEQSAPTGLVHNTTSAFLLPGTTRPSVFIAVTEEGLISAWESGSSSATAVDRSTAGNTVYKGAAIASDGDQPFLYVTDFKGNKVDVFDGSFVAVTDRPFADPDLPAGFAPFGITAIGNVIYVTYAKQGPDKVDDVHGVGNGYVDAYRPDGTLIRRMASAGTLNSPWGVTLAPNSFGKYAGELLVGNFGDGKINAITLAGVEDGLLTDASGDEVVIPGLWALESSGTSAKEVLYTAGPDDEQHGLFGRLVPAIRQTSSDSSNSGSGGY